MLDGFSKKLLLITAMGTILLGALFLSFRSVEWLLSILRLPSGLPTTTAIMGIVLIQLVISLATPVTNALSRTFEQVTFVLTEAQALYVSIFAFAALQLLILADLFSVCAPIMGLNEIIRFLEIDRVLVEAPGRQCLSALTIFSFEQIKSIPAAMTILVGYSLLMMLLCLFLVQANKKPATGLINKPEFAAIWYFFAALAFSVYVFLVVPPASSVLQDASAFNLDITQAWEGDQRSLEPRLTDSLPRGVPDTDAAQIGRALLILGLATTALSIFAAQMGGQLISVATNKSAEVDFSKAVLSYILYPVILAADLVVFLIRFATDLLLILFSLAMAVVFTIVIALVLKIGLGMPELGPLRLGEETWRVAANGLDPAAEGDITIVVLPLAIWAAVLLGARIFEWLCRRFPGWSFLKWLEELFRSISRSFKRLADWIADLREIRRS